MTVCLVSEFFDFVLALGDFAVADDDGGAGDAAGVSQAVAEFFVESKVDVDDFAVRAEFSCDFESIGVLVGR